MQAFKQTQMLQLAQMIYHTAFTVLLQLPVDEVMQQHHERSFYGFEPDVAEAAVCGVEPCNGISTQIRKETQVVISEIFAEPTIGIGCAGFLCQNMISDILIRRLQAERGVVLRHIV